MASELLKTKALAARIKEPKVRNFDFGLNLTSVESLIPDLPQPKPQELLDIQEQNRKGRLLDSLNKIGGRLEDSSLDFIRRNEMAIGGGLIQGEDLGTREGFRKLSLTEAKKYEANKQKWIKANDATEEDWDKLSKSSKYRIQSTGNIYLSSNLEDPKDFNVKRRDKNRKIAVDRIVKDMKEFYKTALPGEKYLLPKSLRSIVNIDNKVIKIPGNEQTLEKYLINDLKEATDLEFVRAGDSGVKGVPRSSTSLTKKQRDYYRKNYNKKSMSDIVRHFIGEGVATSNLKYVNLYEKFKRFRRDLLDFEAIKEKDIVKVDPKKYSSDKVTRRVAQDLRNVTLADLGVSGQENKLNRIQREIAEELYKPSSFLKDKLGRTYVPFDLAHRAGYDQFQKLGANYSISTLGPDLPEANRELVKPIENKLKPLYEEQVELFNKGKKNLTKDLSKKIDANNIKIGKIIASEVETDPKIKGRILGVQVDPYNLKVNTTPVDYTKSVDLGILDKAKFGTTGLDSKIKADLIARNYKELIKNIGQEQGFLKKKFITEKQVKKIIESIACPGKAMGGRIGFQDGTSCFEKGKKIINSGNIPEGAAKRNFINFANKAMEIGKQSGRGLRTITKFGVLPEMVIIGADTLIRTGMGDTLNEAFLKASDIYRTDDAYEQADASEINRRMNSNDGELILNLRKFNNERAKLSSLEQAKEADLTLAGDDFAETNSGMTENEIEKFYAPKIQEQENNLFNASISDAEERAGLAKETEFADKKGVDYKKSIVGGFLDTLAEKPGLKQVADLFNTGTVQQPDVSAQAIDNYAPDAFKKTLQKYGPKVTLDAIKRFEAEQEYPEGAVRNKNLQDEERRLLFEAAKNDPALAELYFGPSMTFAGDPIDQTDLQDEMNLDRGIYSQGGRIGYSNGSDGTALAIEESLEAFQRYLKAGGKLSYKDFIALGNEGVSKFFNSGGRVGFKDGPKNPGRRTFMKLAAGIASIPIFGKFFKPAAPLVKKLANSNTVMPDWFPNFVDKFVGRSIGKKIDADLMEYTNPDLPNIKLTRKDDGSILVEGTNEHNQAYNISYEPPGYELIDEKTGKSIKTKGEFEAVEGRHVALGPEDYDTDAFYADELDDLFTSDIADMEKYTTGNVTKTAKDAFGRDTGLKKGMYDSDMAQGQAENRADILRDEGLDEID